MSPIRVVAAACALFASLAAVALSAPSEEPPAGLETGDECNLLAIGRQTQVQLRAIGEHGDVLAANETLAIEQALLNNWLEEVAAAVKAGFGAATRGIAESWADASLFAGHKFQMREVGNDQVASELAYAKTGSDIPSSLHGVWWLDQAHESSVARDGEYRAQVPFGPVRSFDVLAAFGDAPTAWDPQARCVEPLPRYGGERGHWTFLNTKAGWSWLFGAMSTRMTARMCFTNESMDEITMLVGVRVPLVDKWVFPPSALFRMRMERRPWGWNRVTTIGPNVGAIVDKHRSVLTKVFPEEWMAMLDAGSDGTLQYPVLQIIDGDGQRTRYYAEYIRFVYGSANDNQSTQLVGVVAPQNFEVPYEQTCYAFTGGTCHFTACRAERMATCRSGKCVCASGCSGADGTCYPMSNKIVATGFTLRNARWPNSMMRMEPTSSFDEMKVGHLELNVSQHTFSLYELPGAEGGAKKFFLGSDSWPAKVAAIRPTAGTALFGGWGLYAVDLASTWWGAYSPGDIALTLCSLSSTTVAAASFIGAATANGDKATSTAAPASTGTAVTNTATASAALANPATAAIPNLTATGTTLGTGGTAAPSAATATAAVPTEAATTTTSDLTATSTARAASSAAATSAAATTATPAGATTAAASATSASRAATTTTAVTSTTSATAPSANATSSATSNLTATNSTRAATAAATTSSAATSTTTSPTPELTATSPTRASVPTAATTSTAARIEMSMSTTTATTAGAASSLTTSTATSTGTATTAVSSLTTGTAATSSITTTTTFTSSTGSATSSLPISTATTSTTSTTGTSTSTAPTTTSSLIVTAATTSSTTTIAMSTSTTTATTATTRATVAAVMIGKLNAGGSPIWAYLRDGSPVISGYVDGIPGDGGVWIIDPPLPEGVLEHC